MNEVALVLVHGANHQSIVWEPTVAELRRLVPDGQVLAVDLPGRGSVPADLETLSVTTCVTSIIEQIDAAGLDQVVLVGHSLGGLMIPGVAIELGPTRVRGLVFIAATIPPEGQRVVDTLKGVARWAAPVAARRRRLSRYPRSAAARAFCNGMTDEQRAFVLDHLCPDAAWLVTEPVSRAGLSNAIPRTWVLTTDDRAVAPEQQRRNIDNLGGIDAVVELATAHDAMVSAPTELAPILVESWTAGAPAA